jgi:hypothetical protein
MVVIVDVLHGFEGFDKGLIPILIQFFEDHFLFSLVRGIAVVFRFAYFQGINLGVSSQPDKDFFEFAS